MRIYNTLTRKIEEFVPINPPHVGMYTCGPTVYWSTHIGHMSKYVGDDVLRRALTYNGYEVTHVMNVTDVGHLTSDADEGEDKMEKGAAREGMSVWEIAKKYEKEFFDTMDELNDLRPDVICRATEHIVEQVELIKRLGKKGFTYETDQAVYFDVSKFPSYSQLSGQRLEEKITGAREDVVVDPGKRNPYDFALWMKCVGRFSNHIMRWDSPWGEGFPGWHIECSAMSMKYLGEQFDIHTGGIDHIGVHHPAEIAQSEAATGKRPFVRYWIHRVHIVVDGKKMSKSWGNFYTLDDVKGRGFEPLALRYLFLAGHYRTAMNFTWEALGSAQVAFNRLTDKARELKSGSEQEGVAEVGCAQYEEDFMEAINDDLNTPQALAVMWKMLDDGSLPAKAKLTSLLRFDTVFGLKLAEAAKGEAKEVAVPDEVRRLIDERGKLRRAKDFSGADEVRKKILEMGYNVEDTERGPKINKINKAVTQ